MFVSQEPIPDWTGEQLPDIEGHEGDYDIVYYESEPGYIIVASCENGARIDRQSERRSRPPRSHSSLPG